MQYLGLTIKNDRFYVDELLEKVSEKRLSDFKLTDIYDAIIDNDHDAIMNGYCKKEYFNSLLYWSAPKIAFLIENGRPYEQYKYKVIESEKKGIIYLIKIGEGLYKFGRTKDIKRRFLEYPRGSQIIRWEYVDNQVEAEKILLATVKESNGKLYQGNEYFYFKNAKEPEEIFEKALKRLKYIEPERHQ